MNTPRWTKIILGNAVMLGKRGVIQTWGQNSSVNDSYWRFPKSTVHHKRRLLHTRGLSMRAGSKPVQDHTYEFRIQSQTAHYLKSQWKRFSGLEWHWRNTKTSFGPIREHLKSTEGVFEKVFGFFFPQGLVYLRLAVSSLCSGGWLWNVFLFKLTISFLLFV